MTLLSCPLAKELWLLSQVFIPGEGQLLPGKVRKQDSISPESVGIFNSCSIPIAWFTCFSSHIDFFSHHLFPLEFLPGMSALLQALLSSCCCISSQTRVGKLLWEKRINEVDFSVPNLFTMQKLLICFKSKKQELDLSWKISICASSCLYPANNRASYSETLQAVRKS